MKYYKNTQTGEVFGFDETDPTQLPYMQEKIGAGFEDVTGSWPLPPELQPEPEVVDPAEKLRLFLALNPDVSDLIK